MISKIILSSALISCARGAMGTRVQHILVPETKQISYGQLLVKTWLARTYESCIELGANLKDGQYVPEILEDFKPLKLDNKRGLHVRHNLYSFKQDDMVSGEPVLYARLEHRETSKYLSTYKFRSRGELVHFLAMLQDCYFGKCRIPFSQSNVYDPDVKRDHKLMLLNKNDTCVIKVRRPNANNPFRFENIDMPCRYVGFLPETEQGPKDGQHELTVITTGKKVLVPAKCNPTKAERNKDNQILWETVKLYDAAAASKASPVVPKPGTSTAPKPITPATVATPTGITPGQVHAARSA